MGPACTCFPAALTGTSASPAPSPAPLPLQPQAIARALPRRQPPPQAPAPGFGTASGSPQPVRAALPPPLRITQLVQSAEPQPARPGRQPQLHSRPGQPRWSAACPAWRDEQRAPGCSAPCTRPALSAPWAACSRQRPPASPLLAMFGAHSQSMRLPCKSPPLWGELVCCRNLSRWWLPSKGPPWLGWWDISCS